MEDGIFTIEYIKYVKKMICLKGNYYNYRDTLNSLSKQHDEKIFGYFELIYEKYREIYEKSYDSENSIAREYRFQLIHGTILREIEGLNFKSTNKMLSIAFSSQKRREYYLEFHPRNPYFSLIRMGLSKD